MEIITGRAAIRPVIEDAIERYKADGQGAFLAILDKNVLLKKVKFPVLEYVAGLLYDALPEERQISIMDSIIHLHRVGGNTVAGYMLQLRLEQHFNESFTKAIEYITEGNEWYVCDIIGERVMGHGLLMYPQQAMPKLKAMAMHDDKWIVRAVGTATHYAVKKGLKKQYVHELFGLLLQLAGTTDFHTKKGVGWAAKTIAKFHPEIIEQYRDTIDGGEVKQWFKTKIKIGLGRTGKYAHRYTE